MSTGLLYHGFGLRGYRYLRAETGKAEPGAALPFVERLRLDRLSGRCFGQLGAGKTLGDPLVGGALLELHRFGIAHGL